MFSLSYGSWPWIFSVAQAGFQFDMCISTLGLSLLGDWDYRLTLLVLNAFDYHVSQILCSIDKPFNLSGPGSFMMANLDDQPIELIVG